VAHGRFEKARNMFHVPTFNFLAIALNNTLARAARPAPPKMQE
jgi:hypothetical protein